MRRQGAVTLPTGCTFLLCVSVCTRSHAAEPHRHSTSIITVVMKENQLRRTPLHTCHTPNSRASCLSIHHCTVLAGPSKIRLVHLVSTSDKAPIRAQKVCTSSPADPLQPGALGSRGPDVPRPATEGRPLLPTIRNARHTVQWRWPSETRFDPTATGRRLETIGDENGQGKQTHTVSTVNLQPMKMTAKSAVSIACAGGSGQPQLPQAAHCRSTLRCLARS